MAKIIAKTEITISRIVDIKSVTRYYLLQSSTAAAPSKPTTNPPGGGWKTTEPSYVSGSTNTLYFADCTVMTNGSFSYSAVSKSSSYEAAKEAWNKANNAQGSIDNLEIGGRNLARETSSSWSDWIIPTANTDNLDYDLAIAYLSDVAKSSGDEYTCSIEIECKDIKQGTLSHPPLLSFVGDVDGDYSYLDKSIWTYREVPKTDGVHRVVWTRSIEQDVLDKTNYDSVGCHCICANWDGTGKFRWRNLKVEKGNKATDWSPAPEDVNSSIDDVIGSYQKDLLDQRTEILKEIDEIVLTAGADYVVKDDYSKYQETVESKFTQMEDGIKMDFSTSREQLNELNKALADTKTEWAKYIRFNEDGIEIGDTDNILKLEIDNDMIRFTKNGVSTGWWDGNNFHTGNIVVEVNERAQFGNFAFVPRSDGSLSFLKVGD